MHPMIQLKLYYICILLENPEELLFKGKPSGIRDNCTFTLDMQEISISSMQADDNMVCIYFTHLFQTRKNGSDLNVNYRNSNNNNKTLNNHIFNQTYFHVMKSTDLESYILLLSKNI